MYDQRILVHSRGSETDSHLPEAIASAVKMMRRNGFKNVTLTDSLPDIGRKLRSREVDAAFSADNSQRILAIASRLDPLVIRDPDTDQMGSLVTPLLAVLPTANKSAFFVLTDAGGIVDPKPHQLVGMTLFAGAFWQMLYGRQYNPRYGLLGYGEELAKQPEIVRTVYGQLSTPSKGGANVRVVEPKEALLEGRVSVVTARNAEIGNYFLKTAEATLELMTTLLREELRGNMPGKVAGLMAKPAFTSVKSRLFHEHAHGAMIGGISYPLMKHHGRMDDTAIYFALRRLAYLSKNSVMRNTQAAFVDTVERNYPKLLATKVA